MPRAIILLPGVGAQGASPADVARAFTSGPSSALVNASRSVIYAYRDSPTDDWRAAAGAEAARLSACGLGCGRLVKLDRAHVARVAAPVLFLLAVTVAVLLVRSGLRENDPPGVEPAGRRCSRAGPRTVVVRAGDTLEAIAERTGTTVEVLARLNPGPRPRAPARRASASASA